MSEPRDNPEVAHEESDINVRAVLGFAAALLVVGVIIHVLLAVLFGYYTREAAQVPRVFPMSADQQQQAPPEPRLQTNPQEDLRQLRAREDVVLRGYEWVDKNAGVARIPIDEAMKLVVQRGFPTREAAK
jgi:hypothetical protein